MAIEYQAQYSNDGGSTWTDFQTWVADLSENLDTSGLSGGIDLRVRARDGDNPTDISAWSDIVQMVAPLVGASAGTSSDSATASVTAGLVGASPGTSSDSASVGGTIGLAATSAGTSADTGTLQQLPALVISGTTVPVRPDGAVLRYEPLAPSRRSGSGDLRSAVTAERPKVPIWSFETPPLSGSEDTNVLAALNVAGSTTATGTLIGSWDDAGTTKTTIDVYVANISRQAVGPTPKWVTAFELVAQNPVQRV